MGVDQSKSIRLDQCTVVTDTNKFIASHEAIVAHYGGKKFSEAYKERLELLKTKLQI